MTSQLQTERNKDGVFRTIEKGKTQNAERLCSYFPSKYIRLNSATYAEQPSKDTAKYFHEVLALPRIQAEPEKS